MSERLTEIEANRPWRERVWFWRPQWYFAYYWDRTISIPKRLLRIVSPVGRGGDQWDWHTLVFGWTFTGRIIVATHRCRMTGRCADAGPLAPDWPFDARVDMDDMDDMDAWVEVERPVSRPAQTPVGDQ